MKRNFFTSSEWNVFFGGSKLSLKHLAFPSNPSISSTTEKCSSLPSFFYTLKNYIAKEFNFSTRVSNWVECSALFHSCNSVRWYAIIVKSTKKKRKKFAKFHLQCYALTLFMDKLKRVGLRVCQQQFCISVSFFHSVSHLHILFFIYLVLCCCFFFRQNTIK